MKFKSPIFTQASGSIAGLTFSRNRGGLYTRARSIPTDPATSFQLTMRAIMATLVNHWNNELTVDQRDAWALYASQVSVTNTLGDAIFLSGQNMYIRTNSVVDQVGGVRRDDAPTQFDTGTIGLVELDSAAVIGDTVTVSFDNTHEWANSDDGFLAVYVSRPQNASINFMKGPWRFAGTFDGDSTTPPTSPDSVTSPFSLATGQRQWIKVRAGIGDGRMTSSLVLGPVVVA